MSECGATLAELTALAAMSAFFTCPLTMWDDLTLLGLRVEAAQPTPASDTNSATIATAIAGDGRLLIIDPICSPPPFPLDESRTLTFAPVSVNDVEMVRSGFEVLARDGVDAMLELVHPDFEMTTPAALSAEPDTYRGREGMRRYWDSFDGGMENVEFIARDFEDLGGGNVLAISVLRGRGRTTGIEVEQEIVLVWEVRDAMAYRINIYASVPEARASVAEGPA